MDPNNSVIKRLWCSHFLYNPYIFYLIDTIFLGSAFEPPYNKLSDKEVPVIDIIVMVFEKHIQCMWYSLELCH